MSELTQSDVDKCFAEIKAAWDKKVKDSGMREGFFIAMDKTGTVSELLYKYQVAKEAVEAEGLVMPELIKGLKVNIS